ncbi:MAG: carbamoyltransferase HypF [Bacteroidetes bacterium]|nr:carbamoyltransferase HypF [Bacteroidota bacterium]MBU2585057.1 carbamoyltransferase HypF [Bacteroidota bacterium]
MISRSKIVIRGAVQGVGFRPYIYRLATELNLKGFVNNSTLGVFIEVEGEKSILDEFILRIEKEKPPISVITSLEFSFLDPKGFKNFEIQKSEPSGEKTAIILPDIAVCTDCLEEMFDPNDRRNHYPFINCTNCGPRFSIIESIPYDRPNTSMRSFQMCEECQTEYEDPLNRRFHAQPIACPKCGPHIELWDESGKIISTRDEALKETAALISEGKIIALKGLGGFHLIVDARNDSAVTRLREKKHREEKPFALMFPKLEAIKDCCEISAFEERLLCSPEAPIVLLRKRYQDSVRIRNSEFGVRNDNSFLLGVQKSNAKLQTTNSALSSPHSALSEFVAPNNPYLGVMLPYTPLHHLLMNELKFPIVATSGNLSEEPMCIDENEALERLSGIADFFLVHNRPIVRHVDDSIVRVIDEREMVMRRARGYAPLPIQIQITGSNVKEDILAVGGHLKNTVALKVGNNVFISQHIGDLSTNEAFGTFQKVIEDFQNLYESKVSKIVCDLHPEYLSTKFAQTKNIKIEQVQHHYAHIAACRAENQIDGKALGVSWDGTGFGFDQTIWGGEFFLTDNSSYKHIGQFRKFRLPGGEAAIKEPRRSALGVLYEIYGEKLFDDKNEFLLSNFSRSELKVLKEMLNKNINCPQTSSAGRLFDAVASLLGITQHSNYEGQAAMMLEFAADHKVYDYYPLKIIGEEQFVIDWEPLIDSITKDAAKKIDIQIISSKFHNSLAELIGQIAEKVGEEKVVLSGGCFQNALLVERCLKRLRESNFKVYWHQRVPPNDGGISLGQIAASGSVKDK